MLGFAEDTGLSYSALFSTKLWKEKGWRMPHHTEDSAPCSSKHYAQGALLYHLQELYSWSKVSLALQTRDSCGIAKTCQHHYHHPTYTQRKKNTKWKQLSHKAVRPWILKHVLASVRNEQLLTVWAILIYGLIPSSQTWFSYASNSTRFYTKN